MQLTVLIMNSVSLNVICLYSPQTLGKVGVVKTVYSDGDMRVAVAGQEWTFNPLCCTPVPHRMEDMNNTLGSGQDREPMRMYPNFTY